MLVDMYFVIIRDKYKLDPAERKEIAMIKTSCHIFRNCDANSLFFVTQIGIDYHWTNFVT